MMSRKIVLVQLPTSHMGAGEKVYPLGLSRLSSTIAKTVERHALDMNIASDPWPELKRLLETVRPEIVAFSFRNLDPLAGHQASYLSSLKTAGLLARTLLPQARIIAGGPAFSLFTKRLMHEVPQLDIGLKGEGELIFPQLLHNDISLEEVPGIAWRKRGRVVLNDPGPQIDMDDLPPLDAVVFRPDEYLRANNYIAAMGIEGKRGCDLWCGYCLYPFLGGTSMRLRSPAKIVDEMEYLFKEHSVNLFHFTDPVINRPQAHFEELCRELSKRKLDISWTGFFREDSVTRNNLTLAMETGLCGVYFSGDALTAGGLKLLNKKMTREDLLHGSRVTSELGLLTMCHFLVNLPGETDMERREAADMLDRILEIHGPVGNLGAVIFNHIRLYPGAPLTTKLIARGELDAETDLLYPVYYNPPLHSHILHDYEAKCHAAGVFSRLGVPL